MRRIAVIRQLLLALLVVLLLIPGLRSRGVAGRSLPPAGGRSQPHLYRGPALHLGPREQKGRSCGMVQQLPRRQRVNLRPGGPVTVSSGEGDPDRFRD